MRAVSWSMLLKTSWLSEGARRTLEISMRIVSRCWNACRVERLPFAALGARGQERGQPPGERRGSGGWMRLRFGQGDEALELGEERRIEELFHVRAKSIKSGALAGQRLHSGFAVKRRL